MHRRRAAVFALFVAVAGLGASARPASANHRDNSLWVTVAINAAGRDRLSITDDNFDSTSYVRLASDVAVALDRPSGSFRSVEDFDGAHVLLDEKLARPDPAGRLSFTLDTGKLQVLADNEGYDSLIVELCTPRVHQVVDALVAPEPAPGSRRGSRCRGWYQQINDPAIRAVVQLDPDRHRYPWAVGRVVGAAAIAFGLLGIGATLLRRGPMRRRSWVSWLLSTGSALGVVPLGWGAATLGLWWTGAVADPMLLGGGPVGEQVARTMLPGLVFLLPALLPAAVLLTVPRRVRPRRAPPPAPVPAGPAAATWWPTAWWPQWAAQGAPRAAPLSHPEFRADRPAEPTPFDPPPTAPRPAPPASPVLPAGDSGLGAARIPR